MPLPESRSGNYVPSIIVVDSTTDKSTRTPLAITGRQLTNADPLDVVILDASGDQITTFLISGTVTANLSATDNAVLDEIDSNTDRLELAGNGVKTVSTAGTDVALSTTTTCKKVVIQSQTDNTGLIAVGATGVDATEATGTGIILYAGDSIDVYDTDLADIFIDSTVDGEGVRFSYYN